MVEDTARKRLETTRAFWNRSPCGGQPDFETRREHRYGMEPWLPEVLDRIAGRHPSVVEIGCGQGTDGIELCTRLPSTGRYIGLDYSPVSVESAAAAARVVQDRLSVVPEFRIGDAEALPFDDDSVPCIYSMGVLHHTADTVQAVREVKRVLRPGGHAYLFLYRVWGIKVASAKALRGVQRAIDRITGIERSLYALLQGRHLEPLLGTMLLECFGVPFMRCYTAAGIRSLMRGLEIVALAPTGYNLPWLHRAPRVHNLLGYFWAIEARKPGPALVL